MLPDSFWLRVHELQLRLTSRTRQRQAAAPTHIANPVHVHATTILQITDVTQRAPGCGQSSPDLLLQLADGREFKADAGMTARCNPVPGDYLITQEDGYSYLNPKAVFERKYSPIKEVVA